MIGHSNADMSRVPAEDIRRMLDDRIESVLNELSPGWMKRGDTAYLTPKSKKDLGSFTVSLGGSAKMPRGCWYRFSQSIGGGSVELVGYVLEGRKDAYREAFDWAKGFLGIEDRRESPEEAAEREQRLAAQREQQEREAARRKAEAAAKAEKRTLSAAEVWKGTQSIRGTQGEAYLVARGLPPISEWPWSPDAVLRFHPALDCELAKSAGLFPAVVAKVQDEFGSGTSVWQIYLDRREPRKADLANPKVGRGPAKGGAVRLGGIEPWIGAAEGIESALAAWVLQDFKRPVWAMLSTSGMTSFEPPMEIERITIFPDSDKGLVQAGRILDPPGITAARGLRDRMTPAGIRCDIMDMATLGDCLDLLQTRRKYEQKSGTAAAPNKSLRGADSHREGASV